VGFSDAFTIGAVAFEAPRSYHQVERSVTTLSRGVSMAQTATIFRIELELSDVDRGVYRSESLRVARHPSEESERLVARVLTFALCWQEGLAFARDLDDADEPALWTHNAQGGIAHWIEVGTTKAKRLHMKSKLADKLTVAVYKGPEDGRDALRREVGRNRIHQAEAIEVLVLAGALVEAIAEVLNRSSSWTVICNEGSLHVVIDDHTFESNLQRIKLVDL